MVYGQALWGDYAYREQRTIDVRRSVIEKIYDAQIAGFSADGAWDPEAIDVIRAERISR